MNQMGGYDGPSYSVKYLGRHHCYTHNLFIRYCGWHDGYIVKEDGDASTDPRQSHSLQGGAQSESHRHQEVS